MIQICMKMGCSQAGGKIVRASQTRRVALEMETLRRRAGRRGLAMA